MSIIADVSFTNPPKSKRCRRSFNVEEIDEDIPYIAGKRVGPDQITFPENKNADRLKTNQRRKYLGWVALRKVNIDNLIPSWTGFNILVSKNVVVLKSSIGYMDSIDSPATDMTTIFQVMVRALKIQEALKLPEIVCVFDQKIYEKAAEIKWKSKELFEDVVIMLGTFHLIMMYMSILSKRFKDAGLFDILVQSSVIAEASCGSALAGSMYNRGVRAYELTYEALISELIEMIICEESDVVIPLIDTSKGIDCDSFEDYLNTDTFKAHENKFRNLVERFKEDSEENNLRKFWLSFLEMVEILLNIIYSTRIGDWELYLECVRDIIPYTFAYDNYNYSRYLTPMLGTMLGLERSHPYTYENFKNGLFTAQITEDASFCRIEPDKVIKMTLNKDSKCSGGTTGVSQNSGAVHRWELNATYRAGLRRCLHAHTNYKRSVDKHSDLSASRIKKDQEDVANIISLIKETFVHPFLGSELISISSGATVPEEYVYDVLNAKIIGEDIMALFIEERLTAGATSDIFSTIKKRKLFSFSQLFKTTSVKVNGKDIILTADKNLFGKISIIMQKRQLDLTEVFKYPLGPLPWALSTPMGCLKKTNKAALVHKLEGPPSLLPVTVQGKQALIIDGMALIRQAKVSKLTFGEPAKKLLETGIAMG